MFGEADELGHGRSCRRRGPGWDCLEVKLHAQKRQRVVGHDAQQHLGHGLPARLQWAEQVHDESDTARPDLVGADELGARVIIEAKFDAELTRAQRSRVYLDRLVGEAPVLLLFVAPPSRLPSLWPGWPCLASLQAEHKDCFEPEPQVVTGPG